MNRAAVDRRPHILGILSLLVSIPLTLSLASSKDAGASESIYNVTTSVIDDAKESIFTMKLKCRPRTDDILTCNLSDPKYRSNYHATPCANSSLCNVEHIRPDNSYVGRFEIKHRNSCVERLTVSAHTTLKQVTFYRIMANHLFAGVDVTGKPEGTYSLIEQSVYGKCEALVKVVRTRIKDRRSEERLAKLVTIPATSNDTTTSSREMLSVKRTRNLETCSPLPGLLIFDSFFYHPMMTSVHFDIKSSIGRIIVSDRAFTSYTTEDIAMKNEELGGNTTMLHVRTSLTLHSVTMVKEPMPHILYPISVELPFVDGFDPSPIKSNNVTSKTTQ